MGMEIPYAIIQRISAAAMMYYGNNNKLTATTMMIFLPRIIGRLRRRRPQSLASQHHLRNAANGSHLTYHWV